MSRSAVWCGFAMVFGVLVACGADNGDSGPGERCDDPNVRCSPATANPDAGVGSKADGERDGAMSVDGDQGVDGGDDSPAPEMGDGSPEDGDPEVDAVAVCERTCDRAQECFPEQAGPCNCDGLLAESDQEMTGDGASQCAISPALVVRCLDALDAFTCEALQGGELPEVCRLCDGVAEDDPVTEEEELPEPPSTMPEGEVGAQCLALTACCEVLGDTRRGVGCASAARVGDEAVCRQSLQALQELGACN